MAHRGSICSEWGGNQVTQLNNTYFQDWSQQIWLSVYNLLNCLFENRNFRDFIPEGRKRKHRLPCMRILLIMMSLVWPLWLQSQAAGNESTYILEAISTKQGLSHNYVSSIVSDDLNLKWIGTENGITKFNGSDFEYIKPGEDFPELLNENIEVLYMDAEFRLWIGTKSGGLSWLNIRTNTIRHVNHLIDPDGEGDMRITALSQDRTGNIWVGTWDDGVFVINPDQDSLIRQFNANQAVYSISQDFYGNMWFCSGQRLYTWFLGADDLVSVRTRGQITDILPDSGRNKLWVAVSGANSMLYAFDYTSRSMDSLETNVPSDFSRKLSLDHYNRLWIGTWGQGVFRSNDNLTDFYQVTLDPKNSSRIQGNYDVILDIQQDQNNVIWVATAHGGLVKLLEGNGFQNADQYVKEETLREHLNCTAIYRNDQYLFAGTFSGVYYGKNFETLRKLVSIPKGKVNAFYEHKDSLFIGTAGGFFIVDLRSEKVVFRSGERVSKVTAFLLQDGILYIGTQQSGLAKVSLNSLGDETAYTWYTERGQDALKLESNRISGISADNEGRIWVSTYNGLHLFDQQTQAISHHSELLDGNLPSLIINSMLLKKEAIWLATPNGLIKLIYKNGQLIVDDLITRKNGLNSDFICSITFDRYENLWLSTHTEIVKLDSEDQSIISYGETNGVRTTSFNNNSFFNFQNDTLYFGGIDNVTFFAPDRLKNFQAVPGVIFTSLRVNNETIRFYSGHKVIDQNIHYARNILLDHNQSFFSMSFVANDFLGNLNVRYRYLLEGHNDEWINLQNQDQINVTGLSPGTYLLKVQASRDNQQWSPIKSIQIRLLSTPWVRPWAILLYCVLAAVVIGFLVKNYNDRLRLRNSLEIARIDKEKETELTEAKLKFFTNISHEFRTPLTLILTPIKELLGQDNLPGKITDKLSYAHRNASRLLSLTNQLLDFRKADHNLLNLELRYGNIVPFAEEVFLFFMKAAEPKKIKYEFLSEKEEIKVPFDRHKMEIVLDNLLSNAMKYTPEGGHIVMSVEEEGQYCKISVSDNGIGMQAEDLEKVFDRFFQIKSSNTARLVGSGIGLAFSKEIIELHHGDIHVYSEINAGTTFSVRLSLDSSQYESVHEEEFIQRKEYVPSLQNDIHPRPDIAQEVTKEHTVLIIDDNPDILDYLEDLLSETYTVLRAEDGEQGGTKAVAEIPDIIVSDVMMPGKDGITLSRELKSQIATSHIPIILLTARSSSIHEIEGLKTGADDYIVKPFDAQIVKARIQNLLQNRKKMRLHLLNKVRFEPKISSDEEPLSREDAFIQQAIDLVEANLDDPSFGIETMMEELHMSQSTLYRKIKSLTGLSLTAFIRSVRLKKSAHFILTTDLNLNEIAYQVGFNDYKYFKSSFKKQFGCVPSQYVDQVQ